MDQTFILGKLSEVMRWNAATAEAEFARITLMARLKYDGYQDFHAGARFIECLVDWLQQFMPELRTTAYEFIRNRLIYISASEMNHLVELFYPEFVEPQLVQAIAQSRSLSPYRIWSDEQATADVASLLRCSLFIELSDGGRIDVFRGRALIPLGLVTSRFLQLQG